MFCIYCGQENRPDAVFCVSCGKPILPPAQHKPSRFGRLGAIHIIGAVVILMLAGTGILFARQEKLIKESKALALLAEQTAESTIAQANQNIGTVKDELAQFKVKSAEDAAAFEEKEAARKPVVVERIVEKPVPSSTKTVSSIVKIWQPAVARITCTFKYTNGSTYAVQSGSGTLITFSSGTRSLITNKHVISDNQGYGPTTCSIKFPGDAATYTAGIDDITLSQKGGDMASIQINSIPVTLGGTAKRDYCTAVPDTGDSIVILGYPAIGGNDLTATEGIISGYDGSYYITSAKVEHGNSGGAAIDLQNNCYLGIPTFVQAGQIESLARILKWQAF